MKKQINLFWFRRDLRLEDNTGLYHALKSDFPVLPIFIFDPTILNQLKHKDDARVQFIHQTIQCLKNKLNSKGSDLHTFYNTPEETFKSLLSQYDIQEVYTNKDYEPYAKERDSMVKQLMASKGIPFHDFKDQVIFEENEILKKDETPYTAFTPYSRKWKEKFKNSYYTKAYPTKQYINNLAMVNITKPIQPLAEIGFHASHLSYPLNQTSQKRIKAYDQTRNFPAIKGTSKLGLHFRFGTISIRDKAQKASSLNEIFLNELIWRDFYMMILFHFPHVTKGAFKPKYNAIEWSNNEEHFAAWCAGKTGYPIVDAGMRELNATGYMHNRVRMIVASFLCKHLLINWQWGEAYFAEKLLDFDLSANNGGWQWAAGSGCDAAPYFRVFNPYLQTEKFDKDLKYVKKWVPELESGTYPEPIIEHKFARERALARYKEGLATN